MRKNRNRRAASPVIASLLLIAICVAASIMVYGWVQSMVGSQSKQAQTYIRVDEMAFTATTVTVSIRNTGSVAAIIQTAYVYDGDTRILKKDEIDCVLQPGALDDSIVLMGFDPALKLAHAYLIKLVTDNGFSVEGTYYTPSSW